MKTNLYMKKTSPNKNELKTICFCVNFDLKIFNSVFLMFYENKSKCWLNIFEVELERFENWLKLTRFKNQTL